MYKYNDNVPVNDDDNDDDNNDNDKVMSPSLTAIILSFMSFALNYL